MRSETLVSPAFQAVSICLLALACPFASALEPVPAPEPALTRAADDLQLNWGRCPPFMPEGCALAVLHGDPTRDNLDVFLKVPGKSTIPLHWHTSSERMILVAGELQVTYDGQAMAVLKPGSYAYGPAKRPHHAACTSVDACILFIAFESPLDAVLVEKPVK